MLPRFFFFFNDTATTEIYTLSLHDALPICARHRRADPGAEPGAAPRGGPRRRDRGAGPRAGHSESDRKSTRLNSSHTGISYAVFCLKKKNGRVSFFIYTVLIRKNTPLPLRN